MRKFSDQVMLSKRFYSFLLCFLTAATVSVSSFAQSEGAVNAPKEAEKGKMNISSVIFGHISDSHEWHLFGMGGKAVSLPLPVIIYNPQRGFSVFSSSRFEEGPYNGYRLVKGGMKEKIVTEDGTNFYDFSITKNVLSMIISVVLLLWIMTSAAKKYNKKGLQTAPSGFQNALEAIVVFIRDEVARPNIGNKYNKYMPLILSIFFFVWINNLLGLLPSGANFTGNIAATGCLALIAFIVIVFSANKQFWAHLFNPPGVPTAIKFILVPIEIISLFIKPIALMIRLFANILAGHIVILSFICLIFIFGAISQVAGFGFIPVSLAFSIFMFCLELLVGAIQAFIFANLTAVFIGQAVEEAHHENGQDYHVAEDEVIA